MRRAILYKIKCWYSCQTLISPKYFEIKNILLRHTKADLVPVPNKKNTWMGQDKTVENRRIIVGIHQRKENWRKFLYEPFGFFSLPLSSLDASHFLLGEHRHPLLWRLASDLCSLGSQVLWRTVDLDRPDVLNSSISPVRATTRGSFSLLGRLLFPLVSDLCSQVLWRPLDLDRTDVLASSISPVRAATRGSSSLLSRIFPLASDLCSQVMWRPLDLDRTDDRGSSISPFHAATRGSSCLLKSWACFPMVAFRFRTSNSRHGIKISKEDNKILLSFQIEKTTMIWKSRRPRGR